MSTYSNAGSSICIFKKIFTAGLLFVIPTLTMAVSMNVSPMIARTITSVDLAHYDIAGTGAGAPIFQITIFKPEEEKMEFEIYYDIEFKEPGVSNYAVIYNGRTDKFTMDASEKSITVTSNQFLQKNNKNSRFSRHHSVVWDENDPLRSRLMSNTLKAGNFVSGNIIYTIRLRSLPSKTEIASGVIRAEIINVSQVNPLFPGTHVDNIQGSLSEDVFEVSTSQPQFRWTSDLTPDIYSTQEFWPKDKVFRISVYQLPQDASSKEDVLNAVTRNTYAVWETNQLTSNYPSTARELTDGFYAWKIEGFLIGPVNSTISSNLMVFSKKSATSASAVEVTPESQQVDEVKKQLDQALASVGFSNVLDQMEGYNHSMTIKQDGEIVTIENFKLFIEKINSGQIEVENIIAR